MICHECVTKLELFIYKITLNNLTISVIYFKYDIIIKYGKEF